ncbi:hypothetical protein SAMN05421730_1003213 [Anaerobium acetethylicum]|uniref:Uncharacterized protein n=1 Tax=Anaerobium acetethylicum TaxID=1619234 RepID=A0A1D3TR55_9FIRM|nr:hypothetical protein SAMN05421730_1003213 [Anaerobium acetethylicum]
MIEIPESNNIARQLNEKIKGKTIGNVYFCPVCQPVPEK